MTRKLAAATLALSNATPTNLPTIGNRSNRSFGE